MNQTIDQHQQNRRKYWPTDPEYISKAQKWTPAYKAEKKQLKDKLKEMNDDLALSTPVFSPRFQVQNNVSNWKLSSYVFIISVSHNVLSVLLVPHSGPYFVILMFKPYFKPITWP